MGSLPMMGGPVIGKEYCLSHAARYKLKHSGKNPTFTNKWDIYDENGVVVFGAVREHGKFHSNSSESYKYETQVQDVHGILVARFKFKENQWMYLRARVKRSFAL
jgi:hypothetical protein